MDLSFLSRAFYYLHTSFSITVPRSFVVPSSFFCGHCLAAFGDGGQWGSIGRKLNQKPKEQRCTCKYSTTHITKSELDCLENGQTEAKERNSLPLQFISEKNKHE